MTVMRLLSRRWAAAVVGALALMAVVVALKNPGRVYWAKAEVIFVYPGLASVSSTLDGGTDALVNFAELVRLRAEDLDKNGDTVAGLTGGTLFGAGFRQGVSVILPNMGGQWTKHYSEPRLSVEVVDTDPAQARASMLRVLDAISAAARDVQLEVSTPEDAMVTVTTTPQPVEVVPEGPTTTTAARGLLAGVGAVLLLVPLVLAGRPRHGTLASGASPG